LEEKAKFLIDIITHTRIITKRS